MSRSLVFGQDPSWQQLVAYATETPQWRLAIYVGGADQLELTVEPVTVLREQGLDLETLGITREDLQRRFAAARARQSPEPERLIVQPQQRRKALRTRLQE